MSHEFNSGHGIIDSLQDLQIIADRINDPETKIGHVRQIMGILAARELIGEQFMVSSAMALAQRPDDDPSQRILFNRGMLFVARLESYNYLLDYGIPIDSLTLTFQEPEVIDVLPEDSPAFKTLTLQVPVRAIDSFISTKAA